MILGLVFGRMGRLQEDLIQQQQALRPDSNPAQAHYKFGNALTTDD